jgi:hypothetical protein
MDDENNNNDKNKYSHLTEEKAEKAEKAVTKLTAIRALKKLNGSSKWTLIQEIFQEIQATHVISNPDKLPSTKQMVEELKNEIELRYSDDEELKQLLLNSIPAERSVKTGWMKKEGWDEAVWSKLKISGLFNNEKRAQMIEALWKRGLDKSDNAAKIWLTLSGDYVEKVDHSNDKTLETYREINQILHKKKE